jgi:glycosyltransferase involved in cell wall biosynthesis
LFEISIHYTVFRVFLMSNLAIFVHSLYGGGAERAMVNLARGFSDRGVSVDLVLLRVEGAYLDQVPANVRIIDLGGRRLIFSIHALMRYLWQERPPVMLSTLWDTSVAALWAQFFTRTPTRVFVNVQNTISQEIRNPSRFQNRFMSPLIRTFFPWAKGIVTVSKGVADDLIDLGLPAQNIQVIHNPVVTPELLQQAAKPVAHPWLQPGQPPVAVAVGRLAQQKDFPTLLRAFAKVRQQRPVRLMILGEGSDRPALEQLIQELDLAEDVALPGFVDNPFAYVAQADLFVLSSLYEGLPTVLIEAMAVGTPVVATDCKSGPMEILDNGQYGPLVAVGDVDGLAQAILSTLAAPPDAALLKQRAKHYSLERSVDQYQQLMQVQTPPPAFIAPTP